MRKSLPLRTLFISFFLLSFPFMSFAQHYDYKITGVLTDSLSVPLSSATVYMESAKDSTVVNYTISEDDGKFVLQGKSYAPKVNFYVAYTGFQTYFKSLSFKENTRVDLGHIVMREKTNVLGQVVIQGTAPPILIKEDTLQFNVSSFKTKEGAVLEDLLKKLPGVTVDNQGNIQINGKDVTDIKINGESFFGDDPKIATKNLPKDLIEKVQVVDSKSESQEFTGEESESSDKAINLVIKEENNKGVFARLTAGGGTDERYSLSGIANYFNQDLRLSVLGSANNINSIGFSFDEIYDAMGRSAFSVVTFGPGGMSFDGGGGITKSQAGGLDFVNSWGETVELSTDYFYNRASTRSETKVQRENILPDRRYFNFSNSKSKNINNNHRFNMGFEFEPDSMTRIVVRPHLTVNNGFTHSNSHTRSERPDGTKINQSVREREGKVHGIDFSNRLSYTRKFGGKGGFIRLSFENTNNDQKEKNFNYTQRNIYDDSGNLQDQSVQDQFIEEHQREDEYEIEADLRLPLSEKWKLDFEYEYTHAQNSNERLIYEKNQNGNYNALNNSLSSDFSSRSYIHEPSMGLVYDGEKLYASLTGGVENIRLKNREYFTNTYFENTYNNPFGRFYGRYKINEMQSLSMYFRSYSSVPAMMQLQPVVNKLDPLHLISGNPNLSPTMTNRLSLSYYNFNFKTHFGSNLYVGGRYMNDEVVARTTTDANLVRTTTYTNVDGTYGLYAGGGIHKKYKLKNESTLKPKLRIRARYNKYIGFSNGVKYNSKTFSVGPRVGIEYDIPDLLTIEPSYNIDFNTTRYSLNSQRNQEYTNHDLRLQTTLYWPKNFFFANDITYTHLGMIAPGFENDYVLWNMSLGYKIWDGDGIFKVKVFDVLDQNVSTRRYTGQNYIQDTQKLVLERYVMFSFTLKLSKFGGKGKRNNHMRIMRY